MRIISGKFKGKKLFLPRDIVTRPLKDLTKESIFNLINHSNLIKTDIKGSKVLDLFAGIGSFGLECISRGSNFVTFIENYYPAIKILKKNISSLKLNDNFKIIKKDFFEKKTLNKIKFKQDIIFVDPPYKEIRLNSIFELVKKFNLLEDKGIIIVHRHKNTNDKFSKEFDLLLKKNYGISTIFFFTLKLSK